MSAAGGGGGHRNVSEPPGDVVLRLRGHVAAILAEAHTPASSRAELADELYGHLVERWAELVAEGVAPDEAAQRAIRSFGRPDEVGPDLTRSFHGRMWASTIGILIPGDTPMDRLRPGLIRWLRVGVAIEAILMLVDVAVAFGFTPLRALVTGLPALACFGVLVAAYIGIGRGRSWALPVAMIAFVGDVYEWFTVAHPDGLFISFNGLLAAVLILAVWLSRPDRGAWFADGQRPGRGATLGLAGIVVMAHAGLSIGAVIQDPTQVGAADLDLRIGVACAPSPDAPGDQVVTATVTVRWARHDVLPAGLAGLFSGPRDRDGVLVQAYWTDGPPTDPDSAGSWALTDTPAAEPWLEPGFEWGADPGARATLERTPVWTTGDPFAPTFTDPDVASPGFPIALIPDLMTSGQTYAMTWRFTQRAPVPWPAITARYVHEFRFAVEASAACGETAVGHPAP